jgi:hypothetical protein
MIMVIGTQLNLFRQKRQPVLQEPVVTVLPSRPSDRRWFLERYRREHAFQGYGELGLRNGEAIARYLATAMKVPFVMSVNGEHVRQMQMFKP